MTAPRDAQQRTLLELRAGEVLRIVSLPSEVDLAAQLRVLGIREGETVLLLRRAVFGGPLHLRTACGVEVALGRPAAARVSGLAVAEP
jgi:ferrous iron transport protein A